jgi:sodium/potassium/calcium exchanger 6
MRDASFLTGAIMIITWIVYHQSIFWYHSIILILYYFSYVSVVVLGTYNNNNSKCNNTKQKVEQTIVDESTHLLYQGGDNDI